MRRPSLLPIAVLLCVAVGLPAHAGRSSCRLVTDAAGDADPASVAGVREDALDIRSADVASNRRYVAVAIRLAALPGEVVPWTRAYLVSFRVPGGEYDVTLAARHTAAGWRFYHGYTDGTLYDVVQRTDGAVDEDRMEVRVWAPLDELRVPVRPGARLSKLRVQAADGIEFGVVAPRDQAPDLPGRAKPYVAGAPSCVPIGR